MTDQSECPTCATYTDIRGPVILEEIRRHTDDPAVVLRRWTRFLAGFHGMHAPSGFTGAVTVRMPAP